MGHIDPDIFEHIGELTEEGIERAGSSSCTRSSADAL